MIPGRTDFEMKILSPLVKVFPEEAPVEMTENMRYSGLKGETVSFQAAYYGACMTKEYAQVAVDSEIRDWIRIRSVELVPSAYPCNAAYDDNYLRTTPGMFPDLLRDLEDGKAALIPRQWRALWIDAEIPEDAGAGSYEIVISLKNEKGEDLCSGRGEIKVIDALLPTQKLYHTEWFHGDCLADYYGMEPWSEEYWEMLENYIEVYGKRGMNTILTPVLTPPLDTAVGGERTTIQLAVIKREKGHYSFDFLRLKRWIALCRKYGIRYFEISHLFTQWGAEYAPKVIIREDGELKKIFGWETESDSLDYRDFLKEYLQALTSILIEWGMEDYVYFHTSDEPSEEHLQSYQRARKVIEPYLQGFKTIDALSDHAFYEKGLVEKPVPASDCIEPFLEAKVPGLWTYYCTAQCTAVANRFMAMPSARNRILGVQLYKFGIEGFLHWGFNFYNSQFSLKHINPYAVTDADSAFPSGDAFLVYPGDDKKPEESLRLMVLFHAMQDIRAMELLEHLIGREAVVKEMEKGLGREITFSEYPVSDTWILDFRRRVNEKIEEMTGRMNTEMP